MNDFPNNGLIWFRDGTALGHDFNDPNLLFWACLGRVLSAASQDVAPLASWEAVADECEREFDYIAGQLLARSAPFPYKDVVNEFACWRDVVLDSKSPHPPVLPPTRPAKLGS